MFFSEDKLFQDFLSFCHAQLLTKDVDPVYPLLERLYSHFTPEEALWHTLLYVSYYHLGSVTRVYPHTPVRSALPAQFARLSCATERRGFRGGTISKHLLSVQEITRPYESLTAFFQEGLSRSDPYANWQTLTDRLQRFWGNGRWAAYKTCEILMSVHHYPLVAPNMGNEFSSGPRQGLALFYPTVVGNTPQAVRILDEQGEDLLRRVHKHDIVLHIAQLETMLCDFHAVYEGRYYIGHDIDQMLAQLYTLSPLEAKELFSLRAELFPDAYLGEVHGWNGPDRVRKTLYKKTGVLLLR